MPQSIRRYNTGVSTRSTGSRHSNASQDSSSTAPTSLYSSPSPSLHRSPSERPVYSKQRYEPPPAMTYCSRASTETYTSTVASEADLCEEPETYDPEYMVPEIEEVVEHNLRPSNPSNFADFFPSAKRLLIRHDDTTYDGNMNLRVDVEDRKKRLIQLFHLRMHDLRKREFSLRRYERASGREVFHSSRKYTKPADKRPAALTRSVSNAFASIGKPSFRRTNSGLSTHSHKSKREMKRQDSGYCSTEEDEYEVENFFSENKSMPIPTNTTKLEFSNYAQVEVKRRGAKSSKRYEFEYWGHNYSWKRMKEGSSKEVSYHLYRDESGPAVAHIVPELRSPSQTRVEAKAGGWVPPCSLWISDKSILEASCDVADVVVSTGLIALVDDCIKRHFHSKKHHQVAIPLTPLNMEFVTPKAMIEHVFRRRNSGGSTKEREQRHSPLRYADPVSAY